MKPLAIPLGCQRTTTKWLVITPVPPPRKRERGTGGRYARFTLMLKLRVITAVVLLVLFLLALFALPVFGWIALVVAVVVQGAAEWSRLSGFTGGRAKVFWALTLVMMLGLVSFDAR